MGVIFFFIGSYNKFVLEVYGFYNGNVELNLIEVLCESVEIIIVSKFLE